MDDSEAASGHGMVLHVRKFSAVQSPFYAYSTVINLLTAKCPGNVRAAIDNNNVPLKCSECPENHNCVDDLCCPNKGGGGYA